MVSPIVDNFSVRVSVMHLLFVELGSPDKVTNLTIPHDMITQTSFFVQWSKPFSDPVCGPVQYTITVSTGGMAISYVTINETEYHATGLYNNTMYETTVTAINNGGKSDPATRNVTTLIAGKYIFAAY